MTTRSQETDDTVEQGLLLVYGTLRKGQENHHLLDREGVEYLDTVDVPNFMMFNLGAYPGVKIAAPTYSKYITAELYKVEGDINWAGLDYLEGHPNLYERIEVSTNRGDAWIYVYKRPVINNTLIPSGDWLDAVS